MFCKNPQSVSSTCSFYFYWNYSWFCIHPFLAWLACLHQLRFCAILCPVWPQFARFWPRLCHLITHLRFLQFQTGCDVTDSTVALKQGQIVHQVWHTLYASNVQNMCRSIGKVHHLKQPLLTEINVCLLCVTLEKSFALQSPLSYTKYNYDMILKIWMLLFPFLH